MRECSRNRPITDRTRMFSDNPGTPGRRQQMPRTTRSISTPACDAAYNRSIDSGSTRLFIFMVMRPVPGGAAISPSISSNSRSRMGWGATSSRRYCTSRP